MVLSGGAKVATAEQISQTTGDAEDDQFMDKVKSVQASSKAIDDDSSEDDTLSYFKSLADE